MKNIIFFGSERTLVNWEGVEAIPFYTILKDQMYMQKFL